MKRPIGYFTYTYNQVRYKESKNILVFMESANICVGCHLQLLNAYFRQQNVNEWKDITLSPHHWLFESTWLFHIMMVRNFLFSTVTIYKSISR